MLWGLHVHLPALIAAAHKLRWTFFCCCSLNLRVSLWGLHLYTSNSLRFFSSYKYMLCPNCVSWNKVFVKLSAWSLVSVLKAPFPPQKEKKRMEKKRRVKNMTLYASTPEWDYILVFIMAFVAVRKLQTTCMDSKTNEVILCTFASKWYIFNEHWECKRLQYAV